MKAVFELAAEPRTQLGRTDARRTRKAGRVPAVMYGGGETPQSITLDHNALKNQMSREAFYTSILERTAPPLSPSSLLDTVRICERVGVALHPLHGVEIMVAASAGVSGFSSSVAFTSAWKN